MIKIVFFSCWTLALISANIANPVIVKYISNGISGGTLLVSGKQLTPQYTAIQLNNSSLCKCRNGCSSYIGCLGFSLIETNDTKDCQLTKQHPFTAQYQDQDTALFGFSVDSLDAKHTFIMDDNNFYFIPKPAMYFHLIQGICELVPGFHFAMFKTKKELEALMYMSNAVDLDLFINLQFTGGSDVEWGDSTPLGNITAHNLGLTIPDERYLHYPYYFFQKQFTKFMFSTAHVPYHYLCQAKIEN